jgi:hypothetical protein
MHYTLTYFVSPGIAEPSSEAEQEIDDADKCSNCYAL